MYTNLIICTGLHGCQVVTALALLQESEQFDSQWL